VGRVVAALAERRGGDVSVGYGSGCDPRVPAAVAAARERLERAGSGGRVVVASYLLAPGYFHDRLAEAGADAVTDPLGAHRRVVQIVLDRHLEAVTAASASLPRFPVHRLPAPVR
ncbi:sirohydrochlorin chelatase, partial [Actinotalea ferrariae]|uniref:sirohydrochlorin chelatase n=1 Tax=Actinotalea ferrariae TaxID=1386098 RepID=UPI0035AB7252